MSRSRIIVTTLVCVGLTGAGCAKTDPTKELPPPNPSAAAPISSLLKAAARPDTTEPSSLTASGSTRAVRQAELSARASGALVMLKVEEGDSVKKGQLLFQVDSRDAGLRVRAAKVGLQTAGNNVKAARDDLARKEGLAKTGSVTVAALDNARLNVAEANLALDRAKLALAEANKDAANTLVRSPIDGVIVKKYFNQGEAVSANGAPVVLVADISELEIRANLPERALASIKVGAKAKATFRSLNVEREVAIKRISPTVDMQGRTIEVVYALPNSEGSFKSGMLVEIEVASAPAPRPAPAPSAAPSAGAAK